jgi:hypothetical protein
MTDSCLVIVLDANDNAIESAVVTLDGETQVTNSDGMVQPFTVKPLPSHLLEVEMKSYVKESVTFNGALHIASWNNSLVSRMLTPYRTELIIRLGRLIAAPTERKTDAEVKAMAKVQQNAEKVIISPNGLSGYRNILRDLSIWRVESDLLPSAPPPPTKVGWEKFSGVEVIPAVEAGRKGRFILLLNNDDPMAQPSNQRTFAVAVWSPNIDQDTPLASMDMIVFFSPTTYGLFPGVKYPFGMGYLPPRPDHPGPRKAAQCYLAVASSYLLDFYCFVYMLAARGRQAVVVMPLDNNGDRGPYDTGEGLFRLCREVSLFLHRECRTSSKGYLALTSDLIHCGGTLRGLETGGIFADNFGLPPKPGRVAVSGFSNAVGGWMKTIRRSKKTVKVLQKGVLIQLMSRWGLSATYEQRFWGCPHNSLGSPSDREPEDLWQEAWRELWDMDGSQPGGWRNYLARVNLWAFPNEPTTPPTGERMVFMCHSLLSINDNDPRTDKNQFWAKMKKETPSSVENYNGWPVTREVKGRRWAVAYINKIYYDIGVGVPELGDDSHHATAKVAWNWFTALSNVGGPRWP